MCEDRLGNAMRQLIFFILIFYPFLCVTHPFSEDVNFEKPLLSVPESNPASMFALVHASPIDGSPMPRFAVDTSWPKIPEGYLLGQVSGVSVDSQGDIWIVNRPRSLHAMDLGATRSPPISECCRPLKEVIEFNFKGEIKRSWGGNDIAPVLEGIKQFPENIHGIYSDAQDNIWIGRNGKGDHVIAQFTSDGEYLTQFGLRNKTRGNLDTEMLGNPADIYFDISTSKVFVADGYTNRRIIQFDYNSRKFEQYWGAFGGLPENESRDKTFDFTQAMTTPEGGVDPRLANFSDIVHCIVRGPDGYYYVCDRRNNRVQIFAMTNKGKVEFVDSIVIADVTGGTGSATDIAWSPNGKYMYVADMINGKIWVFDSKNHRKLGSLGRPGRYAGQFHWLHSLDADQEGNLYATEVHTGQRIQKLLFLGVE